jgi:hypothetical protein
LRVAGRGFHVAGRGFAHNGLGTHHLAGHAARTFGNAGRAFAARNIGRAAATVGAAHLTGRNFAQNSFAHAGFGNNWHNNWHGRFPHPNPGFRNWWGYGWYGPVFWPFAYDVLFADLFWPWYYDYPFWAYGYTDLYGALFWSYGYDDLAGYLPSDPATVTATYGGTSGSAAGVRSSTTSTRIARAAAGRQAELTSQIRQSCGEDSKEVAGWPIDRIEQTITPTADQRAPSMTSRTLPSGVPRRSRRPVRLPSPSGPRDGWTPWRAGSRGWCRRSTSSGLRSTSFMHH